MTEIDLKKIFTRIALLIIAFIFHVKCYYINIETGGTSSALGGFFEMVILALVSTVLGFIILLFIGWRKAKLIDHTLFFLTTPIPIVIIMGMFTLIFK